MSGYDILMTIGTVAVVLVIVKGFWSATRVKPLDQPDNPGNHTTAGNPD